MVNTRRTFLFFFMDLMSGLMYKEGSDRMIRKVNPFSGEECALPESPANWDQMQLTFARNTHYWGINRSFTNSFKFVGAGGRILRSLLYSGRGTESNVQLIICKWDDTTGVYRLYYSGMIDFGKDGDQVTEGITVGTLEGGLSGLIKSSEQALYEIPCDGSIPENIMVNIDGIKFDDVFHYQIAAFSPAGIGGDFIVPATFVGNDGDSIGAVKGNPTFEPLTAGYYQKSPNKLTSFETDTYFRLYGNITLKSDSSIHNTGFRMNTATSRTTTIAGGQTRCKGLVLPGKYSPDGGWIANSVTLDGQRMFSFDVSDTLFAGENLFMTAFNNFGEFPISFIGGEFHLAFSTKQRAARVVAITMWDLFRLIMNGMYAKHLAIGGQPINFEVQSDLLQEHIEVTTTSGDAIRSSTDPNYYQYYNQATQNPANPNNQNYNQFTSLGPVIKPSLSDLFDSANPLFNACLGVLKQGNKEIVFLEKKKKVMDPSVITMSLSKLDNLRVSVAMDYYFNWIKAGYQEQKYDEKSGKFEYNAATQLQAPIRSVTKVLELVSKWRADSYGIQYTLYNTQGGKSATYNQSDGDIFMIAADFASYIFNFYSITFQSNVPNPASGNSDNIVLVPKQAYQPVTFTTIDGNYFNMDIDFSIFMFNENVASTDRINNLQFSCQLNGLLGDTSTIKMYLNGAVIKQYTKAVTGVNTPFDISESFHQVYGPGDNVYFSVETAGTCTTTINDFEWNVDTGYVIATNAGSITAPASTVRKLISLPIITPALVGGIPVVSSGFQYFRFLSNVANRNFNWTFMIAGYTNGGGSEFVRFDLWRNGVKIGTDTFFGQGSLQPFNALHSVLFSGNLTFDLNDIVWITASPTNLSAWVSNGELRFTSKVKAYNLLRKKYDSITGVPNPETAYNIDPFTPGRMIRANGSLISPIISNQSPAMLTWQTADKNSFVATSINGQVINERANIDVHELDSPLFWPFYLEFDTEVPVNFNDLLVGQANGHIELLWGDKKIYGIPIQVTSKPAYNESQSWKLLCSPRTNLSDLADLDWDGLIPLQPMDSLIPFLSPLHFVPIDYQKTAGDNSYTMDEDWFKNRYADWLSNNDFFNPWQQDDTISLQFQSYGLDPVKVQVRDGDGNPIGSPISAANIPTVALPPGQKLYNLDIPLNTFSEGDYYFTVTFGIGEGAAVWISEPISVRAKWENTIRFKYKHSRNMLGVVFTEGYNPMFRTYGKIMRFTPKTKRTQFVDQNQDADTIQASPYRTWKLHVGHTELVPDYVTDLIEEIFGLDNVLINGNQYTKDVENDWEYQTFTGEPKVIMTGDIRLAKNKLANIQNTAGQLTDDLSGGYTIDPAAFGQSLDGQDLIQVTND